MVTSKKLGNQFEREFCEILSHRGVWCHNLTQNASGQPADVIAVKNNEAYLIDCKVCTNDRFPLSRIEENQKLAMKAWEESGNNDCWFALKVNTGIYMIRFYTLLYALENGKSSLDLGYIMKMCPLHDWLQVRGW